MVRGKDSLLTFGGVVGELNRYCKNLVIAHPGPELPASPGGF